MLQIFSAREKLQLDVYGLTAVLQSQLQTDDSFVLNSVLSRIKNSIQRLPEADESDNQALTDLKVLGSPSPLSPSFIIYFTVSGVCKLNLQSD